MHSHNVIPDIVTPEHHCCFKMVVRHYISLAGCTGIKQTFNFSYKNIFFADTGCNQANGGIKVD